MEGFHDEEEIVRFEGLIQKPVELQIGAMMPVELGKNVRSQSCFEARNNPVTMLADILLAALAEPPVGDS